MLTHFRIPETKDRRLLLASYQRRGLKEALAVEENGNFRYSIILWSDLKKSIKSVLAAAVVLWRAFQVEWGSVYIIANDLKQADSRVFYYIRRAIELNPYLKEVVKVNNYKIILPNHTFIEAIPIDPSGEAGGNADCLVFSELWGAHQKAQEKMWCLDEQTEVLTQRGWIFGKELVVSDTIAIFDPSEKEAWLNWETPKGIFKESYQGEMHLYEGNDFSQCVTPRHRMYGAYDKNLEPGIIRSNALRNGSEDRFYFANVNGDGSIYYSEPSKREDWQTIPDYNGIVWCPSVSTGLFVTRRKGKVCITGNTEQTLSPTKFGKSFRWIETYAGYTGESPLLERLYQTGVKEGKQFEWAKEKVKPPLEAFRNENARMFALWNTTPRLSWQTPEYYASEAAILPEAEFNRVHRNQWASSAQTFVPAEWWFACQDALPVADKNESMIVAMDAAVSGDCFGVLMVSGRGDGLFDVRYSRAWKPPKGGKLDFSGEDGPERELRRLLETYNVIEVAYDPYQLEDMASRLSNELLGVFYAFNQGQERAVADKSLRDMIREKRIHHDGNQHDLNEHVSNANMEISGEKMRITKKADHMKIDLCVCLSMALARATYWNI